MNVRIENGYFLLRPFLYLRTAFLLALVVSYAEYIFSTVALKNVLPTKYLQE